MHQMSFGGRAPPGPAGGAYSAPQTPSCIALSDQKFTKISFGGRAPPGPTEGAYNRAPKPPDDWGPYQIKHFQTKTAPNVVWWLIATLKLAELTALAPLAALHFRTKNAPNVVCRPGSARTRWGSLQRSPRLRSCIETPRAFGARYSAPTMRFALRLRRSEAKRSGSSFSSHSNTAGRGRRPQTTALTAKDRVVKFQTGKRNRWLK